MIVAFEAPPAVLLLGALSGLTYGLLGAGLVLIFRSSRIINFGHAEIGVFSATIFGLLVNRWDLPYYAGFLLALALGGAVGATGEIAVVRRLARAPRVMSIVATLGFGQFLLFFGSTFSEQVTTTGFPEPPFVPEFEVGALRMTSAYSGILVMSPLVILAITLFLRRSRLGVDLRAAAANPDAARLAGISAERMSSLSWAIAGALSAFTAILVLPTGGLTGGFGPALLMRALVAAVIGRMVSLPICLVAGVLVGVVEETLTWNFARAGLVELALFLLVLVALLVQPRLTGRDPDKGSWASVESWRPLRLPKQAPLHLRHLASGLAVAATVVAMALPALISNNSATILVSIIGFAIVGLSIGLLTGMGGQLSLGQFALAGVGAAVSVHISTRTGSFPLSFLYAGVAAAAVSLVIGLPALRIRGAMLTVTTLSFAIVTPGWLLQQSWALGDGRAPGRPIVFDAALTSSRSYYYFALAVLVVVLLVVRNLRRGSFGRKLTAVRDNEDGARAFGIAANAVKIQGYLLAGFIAGIGGAVYGHSFSQLGASAFPSSANIDVAAMAVIGGLGVAIGPILGALYVIGIPAFLPLDSAGLAATQLGWLILVLYAPGGIAQLARPVRDRFHAWALRGADVEEESVDRSGPTARRPVDSSRVAAEAGARRDQRRDVILEVEELRRRFGGVVAVDGITFQVRRHDVVGLIGANGAGKTTTFEILGGFTRPDGGSVWFDGRDVTRLSAEKRAALGLVRSFQDAALFPSASVMDSVLLALENESPSVLAESLLGLRTAERRRAAKARELVGDLGLDRYADHQIRELSTGTRRITEICCLLALEPTVLLLDEPSSGIAQRETEALGDLLASLRNDLGITLVVIEHDMPLISRLADELIVMDTGKVIARGRPEEVKANPEVIAAYLGNSGAAIERSGRTAPLQRGRSPSLAGRADESHRGSDRTSARHV